MAAEPVVVDSPAAPVREQAEAPGISIRRICLPSVVIAGLAAWLSWRGWEALAQYGPVHSIWAGQFSLGLAPLGEQHLVRVRDQPIAHQ